MYIKDENMIVYFFILYRVFFCCIFVEVIINCKLNEDEIDEIIGYVMWVFLFLFGILVDGFNG